MVGIKLTDEQMKEMEFECKRTDEAFLRGRKGMFLLQVWPKHKIAEGGFIEKEIAETLYEVMREYIT